MLTDKHIISGLIKSRELYINLTNLVSSKEISTQSLPIFNEISIFYDSDPAATKVDLDTLLSSLSRKYPKQLDFFSSVLKNLPEIESNSNLVNEIIEYKRTIAGEELAGKLLNAASSYDDVVKLMEEYKLIGALAESKDAIIAKPIDELVKVFSKDGLFPLYPSALNQRCEGGVPLHTHIGLIGPPESGKSLFGINLASQAAKHNHKVLYIGNEDPIDMYIMRIINRITNMTRRDILANPRQAGKLLDSNGYSNIILDDAAPCKFSKIEKLINKYEPRYVVIDQIRQVHMPGVDGDTAQLTAATKEARRLCKQYPIIVLSITQAGDSSYNKLVLDMGDVYMSNTTFPGDVDIFIGWGTNDAYTAQNRRVINLAKNKITGNHEHFSVLIDPLRSKIWSEE